MLAYPSLPSSTSPILQPLPDGKHGEKVTTMIKIKKKKNRQKAIMLVHDLYYGEKEGTKVRAGLRRFRSVGSARRV